MDESVLEVVVSDDDETIVEEVVSDDDVEEVIVEEDEDEEYEEEVIDDDDLGALPETPTPGAARARRQQRQSMVEVAKADMNCLVESKADIQIDRDEEHGLGRIIVATKDLGSDLLYKPILRELPALVCKQGDYADFMQNFLECPALHQFGIMDMFCQPLDSPMGKELHDTARALYVLGIMGDSSGSVLKTIHQLLIILQTNGAQYNKDGQGLTALAIFGSKFSHSCSPNIGYTPEAAEKDQALEYKLLRPAKKGETLSFSYLTDVLETPTSERRKLLLETKGFWCQCERCTGPDYTRCLSCPTEDGETVVRVPCRYEKGESEEDCQPYWEVPGSASGERMESGPLESLERQFAKMLEMISRSVERTRAFDKNMYSEYNSPSTLKELVQECQAELSPTHHLTIKALRLLVTVSTKHAFLRILKRTAMGMTIDADPKIYSLLRTSVVAGYKLVLAGECIAAGSSDCNEDDTNLTVTHEANWDRALPMSHITDNLLQLPIHWWPSISLTMTTRYMPILQARFGSMVDHLEEGIVNKWKDIKCMECGTYWNSFRGSTKPGV